MAEKYYLDQEGLERLVNYINDSLSAKANTVDVPSKEDLARYIDEATGFIDQSELDAALADYVTDNDFDAFKETLQTVYHFRGSVEKLAELQALENPELGDVYNIKDTGMNAAWDGEAWDDFGSIVDLSGYLLDEDVDRIAIPTVDAILYGGSSAVVSDMAGLKAMLANDNPEVSVTLKDDMALSELITVPAGKKLNLDLGGNSVSASGVAVYVNGGEAVISNGDIASSNNDAIAVRNGGTVIINDANITSSRSNAISAKEGSIIVNGGSVTSQEAGLLGFKDSNITINGGIITGIDNGPVMGNGSAAGSANDGTNMNVVMNGGKLVAHIQSAGYIACGVYVPNSGSFTMNGGEIESDGCGICMRGGRVTIGENAKIVAKGTSGIKGKVGDSRVVVGPYAIVYDANSKYPAMDTLELVIANGAELVGTDGDIDVLLGEGVTANITDNRA